MVQMKKKKNGRQRSDASRMGLFEALETQGRV